MTSRRKGLPCASVKFLRASSTLETFITQSKNSETTNCQLSSLSGEEARQFYESLLKEENEKETRNQQDCRNTQPKRKFMESYSNRTREMNSLRKRQKDSTLQAENNSRQLNYFLKMAQDGNIDRLRGVIRAGQIDINTTDQFGWTALMCACHSGQKACVKFLLQQGARDDLCNSKGQTAEDIAKRAGANGLLNVFHMHKNKRKQVPSVKNSSSANPVEESLCKICKSTFSGRRQEHNRSTVHLFNCQYKSERTLYHIPESNIGFQLLKKKGWNQEKGETLFKFELTLSQLRTVYMSDCYIHVRFLVFISDHP